MLQLLGTLFPSPLPGLCPWTTLGDFRPLDFPDLVSPSLISITNTTLLETQKISRS